MNRVVLVFPGQGSQYMGMGKQVCEQVPEANRIFEEASDILKRDMKKLCFDGDIAELETTKINQIATYTVSMAMLEAYKKEIGIRPVALMGHSLGEYSALTASGAISFQDGVKIVQARGEFMQEVMDCADYLMFAVIGLDGDQLREVCKRCSSGTDYVGIANYNSPNQSVISGDAYSASEAAKQLEKMGAKVIQLSVKAPFHTMLMKEANVRFGEVLRKYTYSKMIIPVISNMTGRAYEKDLNLAEQLEKHMVSPVLWRNSVEICINQDVDCFIEIGPKSVLTKLGSRSYNVASFHSYDNEKDRKRILEEIHSIETEEKAWYELMRTCVAAAICTPNRNWDDQEYQAGVVKPYQEVKELFYQKKDTTKRATKEEAIVAFRMLESVLTTKKIDVKERQRLLREVIDKSYYYDQLNFEFLDFFE